MASTTPNPQSDASDLLWISVDICCVRYHFSICLEQRLARCQSPALSLLHEGCLLASKAKTPLTHFPKSSSSAMWGFLANPPLSQFCRPTASSGWVCCGAPGQNHVLGMLQWWVEAGLCTSKTQQDQEQTPMKRSRTSHFVHVIPYQIISYRVR